MKVTHPQAELFSQAPTVGSIKLGECFKLFSYNSTYLKVAPVKNLLHSTLIHEAITRGDCFAVNLDTGLFTILPGKQLVEPLKTELKIL